MESCKSRQHPLLQRVTGLSFLLGIITNSVIIGWFFYYKYITIFFLKRLKGSFILVIFLIPFHLCQFFLEFPLYLFYLKDLNMFELLENYKKNNLLFF